MTQKKRKTSSTKKKSTASSKRLTSSSNRKKSNSSNRSKRRSKKKQKNFGGISRSKILSILTISILITFLSLFLKHEIVNAAFNWYCVPIPTGDYASKTVHEAINLHHSIGSNPNNEYKLMSLLSDYVLWFNIKQGSVPKEKVGRGSRYDKFCFGSQPEFTYKEEMENSYQMNFVGFHRLLEPNTAFTEVKKYYCEITGGQIKELYEVPIGTTDKSRIDKINDLYEWFFLIILTLVLVVVSIIHFLTSLPEVVFKSILDILKKLPFGG